MLKFFISIFVGLALAGLCLPLFSLPAAAQSETNWITEEDVGIEYGEKLGLGTKDVRDITVSIIRVAMGLLGIVAVCIVLIGGFIWMTAGGSDEKIGEAKKWIFAGVIGLAIILSAYALSAFVIRQLISATVK